MSIVAIAGLALIGVAFFLCYIVCRTAKMNEKADEHVEKTAEMLRENRNGEKLK